MVDLIENTKKVSPGEEESGNGTGAGAEVTVEKEVQPAMSFRGETIEIGDTSIRKDSANMVLLIVLLIVVLSK